MSNEADAKIKAADVLLQQTKAEHQAQIDALRQESADIIDNIEANSIRQIGEANQKAQLETNRAKAEIERIEAAKVEAVNEIKTTSEAMLAEASQRARQQKEELETALQVSKDEAERALNTERERANRTIEKTTSEMSDKLDTAVAQAQAQIDELESKLEQVRQEHEVEVQQLAATHQASLDEMTKTLKSREEAVDETKKHATSKFAEYKAQIEKLSKQEKELSTSTRYLQENVKALERERSITYINYANIERDSVLACQEFASMVYRLTTYMLRAFRDASVHQSKRMYQTGAAFYAHTARPAFDASMVETKSLYSAHVQPAFDKLANSVNAKYVKHVKPHVDTHVTPIVEGKIMPAYEKYVLPVYTDRIVPAYTNYVVSAKNRALDAAVVGFDAAVLNAESIRSSAWADIQSALVLAQQAMKEAHDIAAGFFITCRRKAFHFLVDCSRGFFDGCLRLVEKYDKNEMVSDGVKGQISSLSDNSETVVSTTIWMSLICLTIMFLPVLFNTVAFLVEIAVIISMELFMWPFRIAWFLCPLRFLFSRREENAMPDAVAVTLVASTDETSKDNDFNAPDLVDDLLNVDVRPITPPEKKEMSTAMRPQTRSVAGKL